MAKIKWVKGNTLTLLLPLYEVTIDEHGEATRTPYTPPAGSELTAGIVAPFKVYEYDADFEDSTVSFTDDGTLPCGKYGVEVKVKEPDRNLRTFKCCQIEIVNCTVELELGDILAEESVVLDADYFVQGPKGDPFTYDDFTPEQIVELQKPAQDKADELTVLERQWSDAEAGRVAAETGRDKAEKDRVIEEGHRVEDERARVNAEDGRARAESGRALAESGRVSAEQGRVTAEQGRAEAETQRETTFATFEDTINSKLDTVSESDFNQIFN